MCTMHVTSTFGIHKYSPLYNVCIQIVSSGKHMHVLRDVNYPVDHVVSPASGLDLCLLLIPVSA